MLEPFPGMHVLLKPHAAITGLRSAAVVSREDNKLVVAQFGSGERVDRVVDVSDVSHVLLTCMCDASMPCPQGRAGSEDRCGIWKELWL